jgi:hypothetical protein
MDYLSLNALESAVLKDEVCGEHRTPAREMLWDSAGATLRVKEGSKLTVNKHGFRWDFYWDIHGIYLGIVWEII